jgi:stage V sporulation protein T
MRATGIVRRMDDLGRVVIPKEIRRQLRIKEGDPLEIYTEGNMVCFQRYSPIDQERWEMALKVAKVMLTDIKFALLDRYGDVMCSNNTNTIIINNEHYSTKIIVDDEVEGYIHALENDAPCERMVEAAKVISALFIED